MYFQNPQNHSCYFFAILNGTLARDFRTLFFLNQTTPRGPLIQWVKSLRI
jgi:hypothetical protein